MVDHFLANCPTDADLQAFVAGRLSGGHTSAVAEHVEGCAKCQSRLESYDQNEASIDSWAGAGAALPFADEAACARAVEHALRGGDGALKSPSEQVDVKRLGDYELIEPLGEGGMGAVYKARHASLDTDFAVKLLHPHRQADRVTIKRFEREMLALGALDHPHVVRAIDAGEEQGVAYLVMEYVDGVDLAQVLHQHKSLSLQHAAEVTRQAALGLAYAHGQGRVHRDVKPSNLMLSADGTIKLLDLGLAQIVGHAVDEPSTGSDDILSVAAADLTRTHQVMGTLEYMAPEQASDSRSVGRPADIYSLGCTFYKLLTGHSPFASSGALSAMSQVMAHVKRPAPPIRQQRADVPEDVAQLLDRMLAKDPGARPQSAEEVARALAPHGEGADLRPLLVAPGAQAERSTDDRQTATRYAPSRAQRSQQRHFPWATTVATMAALLLSSLGLVAYRLWTAQTSSSSIVVQVASAEAAEALATGTAQLVGVQNGTRIGLEPGRIEVSPGEYRVETAEDARVDFSVQRFSIRENQQRVLLASLTPLGGGQLPVERAVVENVQPATPPSVETVVELIPLLDPLRDIRGDDWRLVDGALISHALQPSILHFPYRPPPSYRFEATVERLQKDECLNIGLVAGDQPLIITVDSYPHLGSYSGVYRLDGTDVTQQPSAYTYHGQVLPHRRPVQLIATLQYAGGRATVQLESDGREVFAWRGAASRAGTINLMRPNEPSALTLGNHTAALRVTNVRIVPLEGEGEIIEFTAPSADTQLAAAERAIWKGGVVVLANDNAPEPEAERSPAQLRHAALENLSQSGTLRAEKLADLPSRVNIVAIDMRGSEWLRDEDLAYFAGVEGLQKLQLSGTSVSSTGLDLLGPLPNVTELSLARTGVRQLPERVAQNFPVLARLDLRESSIQELRADVLDGLAASLRILDLSSTPVSDKVWGALDRLHSLRELRLSQTAVSSGGVAALSAVPQLQVLDLSGTRVSDVEPFTGQRFPQLSRLLVLDTPLSQEAVGQLRNALPGVEIASGFGEIDLIGLIDVERDADDSWNANHRWTKTGGVLRPAERSRLALPLLLPIEFDLTMVASREAPGNAPLFGMALSEGTHFAIGFDHELNRGFYTILHGIDGSHDLHSPAKTQMETFPMGSEVKVKLQVRGQHERIDIRAFRNGEEVLAWEGERSRLSAPGSWWEGPDSARPWMSQWHGSVAVKKLTLTPIRGEVKLPTFGPSYAEPDRAVAQWVLDQGGAVQIRFAEGDPQIGLSSADQLPERPFWVTEIDVRGKKLSSDLLARVGRLRRLETLQLVETHFNNADLAPLARTDSLRNVYAGRSSLNDAGMQMLAENSTLQRITFNETAVTDDGVAHFAEHPSLTHLGAGAADLTDRVIEVAATIPHLGNLGLNLTQITGAGLAQLEGKQSLKRLHINQCSLLQADDLVHVTTLSNLEVLDAQQNDFGLQACVRLAGMAGLRELRLFGNPIGDEGVAQLATLRELRELSLGRTGVTDAAMDTIANFPKVEHLELRDNAGVTDRSLSRLVTISNLRELHITGTHISASGVQKLRRGLPHCQIHFEASTADGRRLDFTDRGVTDETLPLALEGQQPTQLVLHGEGITDVSLPCIAALGNLTALELRETAVTNNGLAVLADAQSLEQLSLWEMPHITEEALRHIAKIPHLQRIMLKSTGIYGPGLQHLHDRDARGLREITGLYIGHGQLEGEMLRQYVLPFGELKNLDLAGSRISDEDVAAIAAEMKITNFLHLGFNRNIKGPALKYVRDMREVNSLSLVGSAIDDASLRHLVGADHLRKLHLRKTAITDAAVATLGMLAGLHELQLSETAITEEGVRRLSDILPSTLIVAEHLNQAGVAYPPVGSQQVSAAGWKSSWSPDGNQIVYGLPNGMGLEVVEVETGRTRRLIGRGKDAAWSPRGDWIAYVEEPYHNAHGREEIWLIRPNGADARKVTEGVYPSWTAGGGTLLFYDRQLPGLMSVDIDQDGQPAEAVHRESFYARAPSLYCVATQDGKYLAHGSKGTLYVVARETRAVVFSRPFADTTASGLPSFSPDDRLIAFAPFGGTEPGVWVFDWRNGAGVRLNDGTYNAPSWSPDGARIAFDYRRGGGVDQPEIWVTPAPIIDLSDVNGLKSFPRATLPSRLQEVEVEAAREPQLELPLATLKIGDGLAATDFVPSGTYSSFVKADSDICEIVPGGLKPGANCYTDRTYELLEVPVELEGLTLLKTRMGHKSIVDARYAIVASLAKPGFCFVAIDERSIDSYERTGMPSWLEDFTLTDFRITTSDVNMRRFGKDFLVLVKPVSAGEVKLGPAASLPDACSMYFAFFGSGAEQSSSQDFTAPAGGPSSTPLVGGQRGE